MDIQKIVSQMTLREKLAQMVFWCSVIKKMSFMKMKDAANLCAMTPQPDSVSMLRTLSIQAASCWWMVLNAQADLRSPYGT